MFQKKGEETGIGKWKIGILNMVEEKWKITDKHILSHYKEQNSNTSS